MTMAATEITLPGNIDLKNFNPVCAQGTKPRFPDNGRKGFFAAFT